MFPLVPFLEEVASGPWSLVICSQRNYVSNVWNEPGIHADSASGFSTSSTRTLSQQVSYGGFRFIVRGAPHCKCISYGSVVKLIYSAVLWTTRTFSSGTPYGPLPLLLGSACSTEYSVGSPPCTLIIRRDFYAIFADSQILMDLPELYHYGREKYWFSWRDFFIYMLDGIYQVSFAVLYLVHPH